MSALKSADRVEAWLAANRADYITRERLLLDMLRDLAGLKGPRESLTPERQVEAVILIEMASVFIGWGENLGNPNDV